MWTEDPPREKQVNAFVGINGVEVLDLGLRQRTTHVKGRYTAPDEFTLGALFATLGAYKNAFSYTLVTTKGQVYNFVQLHSYAEIPPARRDGATGYVYQDFTVVLNHLFG